MLKLYYVVIYHHSDNVLERFILTAGSIDEAGAEVMDGRGRGWKIQRCTYVCDTPTETYLEV